MHHRPALPRLLAALGLAMALALLSGCNPCDYHVDTWDTQRKPTTKIGENYKNSGYSKEEDERMQRLNADASAKLTPEQRAAREQARQKFIEDVRKEQAGRAPPAPNPYQQRFEPASITDCANRYGYLIFTWLLGVIFIGVVAHFASIGLTGRSLRSWLVGRKNQ